MIKFCQVLSSFVTFCQVLSREQSVFICCASPGESAYLHSRSPSSVDPVPSVPTCHPSVSQPHHSNGSGDSANSKYSQQPHIGQHIGVVFPRLHVCSNTPGVVREC